jgi:HD superfamily phosphodiesterase
MDAAVTRVRDFAERSTRGRDESHGFRHLCDVLALAERICDELVVPVGSPPLERDLVRIAALLHDVCDHKYDHDGKRARHDGAVFGRRSRARAAGQRDFVDRRHGELFERGEEQR